MVRKGKMLKLVIIALLLGLGSKTLASDENFFTEDEPSAAKIAALPAGISKWKAKSSKEKIKKSLKFGKTIEFVEFYEDDTDDKNESYREVFGATRQIQLKEESEQQSHCPESDVLRAGAGGREQINYRQKMRRFESSLLKIISDLYGTDISRSDRTLRVLMLKKCLNIMLKTRQFSDYRILCEYFLNRLEIEVKGEKSQWAEDLFLSSPYW